MDDKILITGLGTTPKPVIYAIQQGDLFAKDFTPLDFYDKIYVVSSDYQRNRVADEVGYSKNNEKVLREYLEESEDEIELNFVNADVFDPLNVYYNVENIISNEIKKDNEVIVNYSSGSAIVRIILNLIGVYLREKYDKIYTIYTISYEEGKKVAREHSKKYLNIIDILRKN